MSAQIGRRKQRHRTAEDAHDAHLQQMREWRERRRGRLEKQIERLPMAQTVRFRQVFLSTTLPILGSYGFGVVVRRSL